MRATTTTTVKENWTKFKDIMRYHQLPSTVFIFQKVRMNTTISFFLKTMVTLGNRSFYLGDLRITVFVSCSCKVFTVSVNVRTLADLFLIIALQNSNGALSWRTRRNGKTEGKGEKNFLLNLSLFCSDHIYLKKRNSLLQQTIVKMIHNGFSIH